MSIWRITLSHFFKIKQRQTKKNVALEILLIHRKSYHFMLTITSKIIVSKSCNISSAENNQLCHETPIYFFAKMVNSYSG